MTRAKKLLERKNFVSRPLIKSLFKKVETLWELEFYFNDELDYIESWNNVVKRMFMDKCAQTRSIIIKPRSL